MHRQQNPNIEILKAAVRQLGSLADDMVFLGGCASGLLVTDDAAPPIRATIDVDAITEVASLSDYYELGEQLRQLGFSEDSSETASIVRWRTQEVILDVLPSDPNILGFGDEWLQSALEHATVIQLEPGMRIKMVTAPYFLATKLSAFDGRGNGDFVISHDMEDIVAILDGRPELIGEIEVCDAQLRKYLCSRFAGLLKDEDFLAAIPGHLPPDAASQARASVVVDRIQSLVEGGLSMRL